MNDPDSQSQDDFQSNAASELSDPYRAPQEIPADRGFGKKSIFGLIFGVVALAGIGLVIVSMLGRSSVEKFQDFGIDRAGPIEEYVRSDAVEMQPESGGGSVAAVAEGAVIEEGPVVP